MPRTPSGAEVGAPGMVSFDPGQKLGQFGNWASDVLLGEKQKTVTPSYQIDYGQMEQDRAQQQALYAQLAAMAAGNGPSLAQGQLQQATDQNIRQAMALGQAQQGQGMGYASALRGIADQSAAARQSAAGQSALIRNQEQMQGMQGMGALGGQMFNQDLARQQLGAGSAFGYDQLNQNAGKRSGGILPGILQAGGAILGGMVGGPAGAAAGGAAGGALGGGGGAGATIQNGSAVLGGGFRGPGFNQPPAGDWSAGNVAYAAHGGQVPGYSDGGVVVDPKMRKFVHYLLSEHARSLSMTTPKAGRQSRGDRDAERERSPSRGGGEEIPQFSGGGRVPGYAQGGQMDSRSNDTVPAMLSPQEIVLPRSVTLAPDAPERAKAFVAAIQAHRAQAPEHDDHHLVRQARQKMESVPRGPLREARTPDVYEQMSRRGFA